jgi:hypothetical protein
MSAKVSELTGRHYRPQTLKRYGYALKVLPTWVFFDSVKPGNLLDVRSIEEFSKIRDKIVSVPGFKEFNEKHNHGDMSAAMSLYEVYLREISGLPVGDDEEIESEEKSSAVTLAEKPLGPDGLAKLLRKHKLEPPDGTPAPKKAPSRVASRPGGSRVVNKITIERAGGKCDLCGKGTFVTETGQMYLECHHVIRRADDGKDDIYNTVALCPTCHRMMHYGTSECKNDGLVKLKEKLKKYAEVEGFKGIFETYFDLISSKKKKPL